MTDLPKKGETYCCDKCGMALVITTSCGCDDATCVELNCCDQPMCLDPAK